MATTLEQSLNEVIAVLEAEIPANPRSKQNANAGDPLERDLKRYFAQIAAVIPEEQLAALYNQYVPPEKVLNARPDSTSGN